MRLRVGDDEVGTPEGAVVHRAKDPRSGRAGPEATAVADERVVERDQGVEHDRPATRRPLRGGHVEVPGVADHDDVGVVVPSPRERALGAGHPRELPETERPVVAPQTSRWRSTTVTPARRRHETTCVLRGDERSYVPK